MATKPRKNPFKQTEYPRMSERTLDSTTRFFVHVLFAVLWETEDCFKFTATVCLVVRSVGESFKATLKERVCGSVCCYWWFTLSVVNSTNPRCSWTTWPAACKASLQPTPVHPSCPPQAATTMPSATLPRQCTRPRSLPEGGLMAISRILFL